MKSKKMGSLVLGLFMLITLNACADQKLETNQDSQTQVATAERALTITVYHSPTCSCCSKWIQHLEENNFNVTSVKSNKMNTIKEKYGVPNSLTSCHTALINDYVIEGHVPASDIQKLIQTKPKIVGLTVPNMPIGSPGMEQGSRKDAYSVMSFSKTGAVKVFNHYPAHSTAS